MMLDIVVDYRFAEIRVFLKKEKKVNKCFEVLIVLAHQMTIYRLPLINTTFLT